MYVCVLFWKAYESLNEAATGELWVDFPAFCIEGILSDFMYVSTDLFFEEK